MASYKRSLQRALRRGLCTFLQNYANLQEVVKFLWEPLPVPQNTPFNAAKHLIPWICNDEPPELPDPAFEGGQCDGVIYEIRVSLRGYDNGFICEQSSVWSPVIETEVRGPITSINQFGDGTTAGGCPAFTGVEVYAKPSSSNPSGRVVLIQAANPNYVAYRIDYVRRKDGLPDDCGDGPIPPPIYNEGDNIVNIEFQYTPRGLPPVILGGVLAIGYANINLNGQITIPFTFNFNANFEGKLTGEFNLNKNEVNLDVRVAPPDSPRLPDDLRPPGGIRIPGTPVEPPPVPEDPIDDEVDEDERDPIRVIKGVVVTVTSINERNPFTEIFQDDNPNVWVPDLGLVQFLIRTGKLNAAWTADIRVKNIRQFIPVPDWEFGAIAVRGTPREGVQWTLTPVYVQVETTNEFSLLP